jgi:hypothetical protein
MTQARELLGQFMYVPPYSEVFGLSRDGERLEEIGVYLIPQGEMDDELAPAPLVFIGTHEGFLRALEISKGV